jgi:hypothetical protein
MISECNGYVKSTQIISLASGTSSVRQDGFPTAEMVGCDGVSAAWPILQHAITDPEFQASWLPTIDRMAQHGELGAQDYALLADRVLLAKGKKQRFGTQFSGFGDLPHIKMCSPDAAAAPPGVRRASRRQSHPMPRRL